MFRGVGGTPNYGTRHLSSILFNIVANMLVILFSRAQEYGQFTGVVPHLVQGGLSILQYADDTVVFWITTWNELVM
jgi:hypothetical protein